MPEATEALQRLAGLVARARSAVVFTGAGISTESGIPDFRSPTGIWAQYRPIDFGDFVSSEEMRREAWRRRFGAASVLDAAQPNRGHVAIAELVRTGRVQTVVTQNVDGLHQASGLPEERVVELHGSTRYARCLDCEQRHELAAVREVFEHSGAAPRCDCGGLLKTATISFGQPMPAEPMRRAEAATLACDLFLALGSSLVVFPAAGFPALAKRHGARLVVVNREPTDLDRLADLAIHAELGPLLEALVARLGAPS